MGRVLPIATMTNQKICKRPGLPPRVGTKAGVGMLCHNLARNNNGQCRTCTVPGYGAVGAPAGTVVQSRTLTFGCFGNTGYTCTAAKCL
jgi:hypothetical protein